MVYVVYHIESTMKERTFDSESGAKRSATCKNRKAKAVKYAYTDAENYLANVVRRVKRTNLMSGKEYWEDSNTPNCCSPSSETYWSM